MPPPYINSMSQLSSLLIMSPSRQFGSTYSVYFQLRRFEASGISFMVFPCFPSPLLTPLPGAELSRFAPPRCSAPLHPLSPLGWGWMEGGGLRPCVTVHALLCFRNSCGWIWEPGGEAVRRWNLLPRVPWPQSCRYYCSFSAPSYTATGIMNACYVTFALWPHIIWRSARNYWNSPRATLRGCS